MFIRAPEHGRSVLSETCFTLGKRNIAAIERAAWNLASRSHDACRLDLKSRPFQHAIGSQLHVDGGDISVTTIGSITYSTP
jgi:hypothetical protein